MAYTKKFCETDLYLRHEKVMIGKNQSPYYYLNGFFILT